MKNRTRFFAVGLLGASLLSLSANAAAHGRDGYRHGYAWGRHYYHEPEVRVVERYYVREPRYYEPVYERRVPVYEPEPGVVVHIGLPPIIIPFHR